MINSKQTAKNKYPKVLILAPTRELANQIYSYAQKLSESVGLKTLLLYGGVSKSDQINLLKNAG